MEWLAEGTFDKLFPTSLVPLDGDTWGFTAELPGRKRLLAVSRLRSQLEPQVALATAKRRQ